jgi:hypothetical protein
MQTPRKSKKQLFRETEVADPGSNPDYIYQQPARTPPPHQGKRLLQQKIITLASRSRYSSIFRLLYSRSKATKEIVKRRVMLEARRELVSFGKDTILAMDATMANLKNFEWEEALEEAESQMPLVMGILKCLLGTKSDPIIGNILSTILYVYKPRTYTFIPTINSVQLSRSGASVHATQSFNHMGFCVGVRASRSAVTRLQAENMGLLMKWKVHIFGILHMFLLRLTVIAGLEEHFHLIL